MNIIYHKKKVGMYNQGDIVWVRYPLTEHPEKLKLRPAVVISHEKSNRLDHDLLICPVTSTLRKTIFSIELISSEVTIPLPAPSEIRCNKIYTIRSEKIIGKISSLKTDLLKKVIEVVSMSFRG
ncbi:MAG: type II toxin-antitoxin system PemK/MazF family toxin [Bacteroidota bacterium]